MVRAALVWPEGEHLRTADLEEARNTTIGRTSGSSIVVDDKTVSRTHAEVRLEEGTFVIENRSSTNPTKVNDQAIDRPVPLSDGDVAELGSVRLAFHDLASADRTSGPICSHCSRENMASDTKCWYCGTFLVNAATVIIQRRTAVCRIASAAGGHYDLHAGEAFVVHPDGRSEIVPEAALPDGAAAVVGLQDDQPVVTSVADGASITVNSEALAAAKTPRTGDELRTSTEHLVFILR